MLYFYGSDDIQFELAKEYLATDVQRICRCLPDARTHGQGDLAQALEGRFDLRAAAMHHDGLYAHELEQGHVLREGGLQGGVGHYSDRKSVV